MERDLMISKLSNLLTGLTKPRAGVGKQFLRPVRGQAAVEFALVLTVAMIVLFVAVQLAIIGEAALSLGQMNYQGARWAAVNVCATDSEVATYMTVVGSPTITTPSSCGSALAISITETNSNNATSTNSATSTSCTAAPTPASSCTPTLRNFGTSVTVNITYTIPSSQLVLGTSFLGISFPTKLTSSETAMAE